MKGYEMEYTTDGEKRRRYHVANDGTVEVNSESAKGHVRTPNFVFDLWLPVLGLTALGVYQTYLRLARNGVVSGYKQKDLARRLGISYNTLTKANGALVSHGFIHIEEVKGAGRLMHKTLSIKVLDAPTKIKIDPEDTLSPWLCVSEVQKEGSPSVNLSASGGTHFEPPGLEDLNLQLLQTSSVEDLDSTYLDPYTPSLSTLYTLDKGNHIGEINSSEILKDFLASLRTWRSDFQAWRYTTPERGAQDVLAEIREVYSRVMYANMNETLTLDMIPGIVEDLSQYGFTWNLQENPYPLSGGHPSNLGMVVEG